MQLTLLQWNVWYQEKADNILSLLKEANADILCLQELTADSSINPGRNLPQEIAGLGYQQHFVTTRTRSGDEHITMGNGIFSKFPLLNRRSVHVQYANDDPETVDKENRIYIEVQLQVAAQELTVGTAHLSHTRGFIESPAKTRETDLLLEAIGSQPSGYIFACDANALPDSMTIKRLNSQFQHAGPSYNEATWSTKRHEFPRATIEGLNWRLDYVFATPDICVLNNGLLRTDVSDHLPIVVTLDI